MRHILGVLTVLAILAGGLGLSWLAESLPRPTLSWLPSPSALEACSDCGLPSDTPIRSGIASDAESGVNNRATSADARPWHRSAASN
jgi:hypothetical protein